ncbi:flagellar motor stator protein MotA [Ketobacter sp. MCCC 1A13808]|uniref:flagellar motor stator protein MotA n=1 Tax=Ketobacter sp. MCCC 1A13808 TaxID=2602738 RepID=UPI000F250859|nr:flagellar motor stator protein MotA [Ketobacter sp. MCCC 1A13808]MVF11630.1 flagellar motor stator protein MotA [Ketobacter sp. MCCC 1A13808]RLP55246.1 MAG: flagellar motor stator protein MotA [Ketobacter sp.]
MSKLFGYLIVIGSVLGGFVLSHGELATLWQPFELLIIGGAAFGAFVVSNPFYVVKEVFHDVGRMFLGRRYGRVLYMDLLSLLYELFNKARRNGLMSIEEDVEDPKASDIFERYPRVTSEPILLEFICDYLRIISSGNLSAFELETLMDQDIETSFQEAEHPAHALSRVSDALPGFGIVAAVLGIVITMKSLGGPPEELGMHVAAALVGTFLGVLLAYGFVGPMSDAMAHSAKERVKALDCIKTSLLAMLNGIPPQLAVEFGRKTLFSSERPSFSELEEHLRSR